MVRTFLVGLLGPFGSLLCLTALISCASAPLRTDDSAAAIRAAQEVGADEVPRAALHLQLAKESVEKATKLYKSGDRDEANSLLTRAEADAELAVALSREQAEKQQALEAVQSVKDLRQSSTDRSN